MVGGAVMMVVDQEGDYGIEIVRIIAFVRIGNPGIDSVDKLVIDSLSESNEVEVEMAKIGYTETQTAIHALRHSTATATTQDERF